MRTDIHRLRAPYRSVEHVLGVVCPLLGALSVLDAAGLLAWAWLLFFWMACGHYSLHACGIYPPLKYRAFVKGLFAFGVGLLWPVWCLGYRRVRGVG